MNIIDNLLSDSISLIAKEISKRPPLRKKLFLILGILAIISIISLFVLKGFRISFNDDIFVLNFAITILILLLLIVVVYSYSPKILKSTSVAERLAELSDRRVQIEEKIEEGKSGNVQEIIKLNLNQLDEYYTINKSQSKSSYSFSVSMIVVGFLFIVTTIVMFFIDNDKYTINIITGVGGVISEFIGLTSLTLYKESVKHLDEFIKRLTYLQKVMLSIDLAEKLPDDRKHEKIADIISILIGSKD